VIAVVAPEPAPWIGALLQLLGSGEEVRVFAPAALATPAPDWLPGRATAYLRRRTLPPGTGATSGQPLWAGAEAALSIWARGRTEQVMTARFLKRQATDAMASRWLPRDARLVVAPSLTARRTFAEAARRGIPRVLVEDLPAIRQLHDDLDRAALHAPGCRFLGRYRAAPVWVARQEAEWVLADALLLRGHFAAECRRLAGLGEKPLLVAPPESGSTLSPAPNPACTSPPRVLLAGLATARNGVLEALAAVSALPGATLLVRAGEGMEPSDLLQRPMCRRASAAEVQRLEGVDMVLAPAWCESHAPEVQLAAARGVPVVATSRAGGPVDLARAGAEVERGDVAGIVAALRRLTATRPRRAPEEPRDEPHLASRLRTLLQELREPAVSSSF
jgi:hypothetical protein